MTVNVDVDYDVNVKTRASASVAAPASVATRPAVVPPRGPDRRARALGMAWWFGAAPTLATLATMRWLVPPPSEIGPGLWGTLAIVGARFTVPLAVALFLMFTGLVRFWRDKLPLAGPWPSPSGAVRPRRTLPQRIVSLSLIVLAGLVALTLRNTVVQLYTVSGASMLPSLLPGDTLIVSRLGRTDVRRGDLIAFRAGKRSTGSPDARTGRPGEDFLVKRVIGLPGDFIKMRAGIPSINGWEVPNCDAGTYARYAANGTLAGRLLVEFLEDRAFLSVHVPGTKSFAGYRVPPGELFVLGDDRSHSEDSRSWGDGHGAGVPLRAVQGHGRRVLGADLSERLDLSRLFERPGLRVPMPGVDTRLLQAGIERCLKNWPKQTWPPRPPARS